MSYLFVRVMKSALSPEARNLLRVMACFAFPLITRTGTPKIPVCGANAEPRDVFRESDSMIHQHILDNLHTFQ